MSLADQFLADLDDDFKDEVMDENLPSAQGTETESYVKDEEEELIKNDPIHYVKVYNSPRLAEILARIAESERKNANATTATTTAVSRDDYDLVSSANSIAAEIAQDVDSLHNFIKERYSKRFPELESLVLAPKDYASTVKMIGNNWDVTSLPLASILPPATVMGITISAPSALTPHNAIPERELLHIVKGCDMLIGLCQNRDLLTDFVESRLLFIAPNVSAVVGSVVAAKLIIAAGGLDELARMPSSNVQLIGQKKFNLSGFSTAEYRPHTGFIFECEAVESVPPELKMKACRLIAGKVTLAARVDASRDPSAASGEIGRGYKEYIDAQLEKMTAPLPGLKDKALPAPDDKPKRKRGGRRLRKMKDRYAMTEVRRQANRLAFNSVEDTYDETGRGFGMLGKGGTGKLRVSASDKGTLKKVKQKAAAMFTAGIATGLRSSKVGTASGLTSTVAFTATQGIELVDPSAEEKSKREEEDNNSGYFSSVTPFLSKKGGFQGF